MDIEEGEIIISDVSSDDSNDNQPQTWGKDKFQVEFGSFRFQSTSRSNTIPLATRSKDNHYCNDNSFCRKTWRHCLVKDSSGQRISSRNIRSETFSSDSVSRTQNQRNRAKQRPKKRKRKGRSETSSKHKAEKTLHQLINHCENRSALINEIIQLSRTPASATLAHESTSLMQKLITSGLAKPPDRSREPSDIGTVLSSSESENCVKKENVTVIDIENKNYSDDSDIEVIIPPKKVPLLVTLDSDGDEVEQPEKDSGLSLETPNHEPLQTLNNVTSILSEINNNPTLDQNKTSNEINLNNNELSTGNSPLHTTSELVNDSSDSLSSELVSELCGFLSYSPSSPSTCNSSDVDFTKNPSSQSPPAIGNSTSQNSQFEEIHKDSSTVSNEEISSEIWLDLNEEQTSENRGETNTFTSLQIDRPRKDVNKDYITSEVENNENPIFDNDNSLSALVENFIMCSASFTENVNSKKQQMGIDEKIHSCKETVCENEPEKHSQSKFGELSNQNQTIKQCNNGHTNDSFILNENHLSTNEETSSDDREPYSPSSSYNCDKIIRNDIAFSVVSNSNDPDSMISKQLTHVETPPSESTNDDFTKSSPHNLDHTVLKTTLISNEVCNGIDIATVTDNKEPELRIDKENMCVTNENNNQKLHQESIDTNIGKRSDDDEEDNVSQLRMIALQTKGKTILKETKPAECIEKSVTHLPSNQNDNVTELNISECTPQNVLDDEDDVLQLRVAALKSAVMKKYGERKKRGLLVKKRKRAASGLADDIITSPESNLTLEQDNSSPLSPAKSSKSLQGEEDMELAESDFGEDIIEESNAISFEKEPSDPVTLGSCSISDPSARTYEIPSTIHTHSRNLSLSVPPQPLPPGVDGNCPEFISQSIFSSVIPPPPPPPPLIFSPILPPPPPPPIPSSSIESCTQFNQPPIFPNHSKSRSAVDSLDKICPQKQSASTSNITFSDTLYDEGLKNNSPIDSEPSNSSQLVASEKSKKLDTIENQVRGNLITVPVVKNMLKPVLTKNQLKQRKRKRNRSGRNKNKSVTVLTKPESSLLCITKPPGKSSINLRGNINLKTFKRTNTQSGYRINNENNPEISCNSYESITPVILCNTKPHVGSWKDTDNLRGYEEIWPKNQELLQSGISSAKSNLTEETNIIEDEIDLSEMIVIDEVGMSPEHKGKNEGSWDYSSPQEEDEDENTLRIRALTSLSPKPVVKKPTSTSEVSSPWPQTQPEKYHKSWEFNEPSKADYNPRRGLIISRETPKEVHTQRRVVGIDTSKYRLTRTTCNEQRRSVVHGRESLKVVVPTNSPPQTLPSEPSLPVVKRLVINVDKDSDSEEECEWTRKIRIQDTHTTLPSAPVVDYELERSIDELLMRARNSVDYSSPLKQNQSGNARSPTLKPESRKISENDFSLQDTPLKLLPKDKQEEYKRLKAILERKEKERQQKKIALAKAPDKSKPLLQHVLINENNKQNQKDQHLPQDSKSDDDKKRKRDKCMDYRIVQSRNSADLIKSSELDKSSRIVQDPAKSNKQKNFSLESSGKGNCIRKVIFNETNKLKVNSAQENSASFHEMSKDDYLQSKVLKSINENVRKANNITCENSGTNLNNQRKSLEASQSTSVGNSSKQSSTVRSAHIMKQMQEDFDSNMQQQTTTVLDLKDVDNAKCIDGNQLETEKENSPKMGTCQSNSNEELYTSAPQILPAEDDNPRIQTSNVEKEERGSKEYECSTEVITKNEATANATLEDKIPDQDTCEEPYDDENRVNNFKTNTPVTDDVRCLMDEGGKGDPVEKVGTQMRVSSSSLQCELEKQGEVKERINNNRNSDSNKDNNDAKSSEELSSSDILDDSHAAQQEFTQNEYPREELSTKKSELLGERFGLLDDLSEMAESLDDLDNHQGRLEQAAVEISALRRALHAAEESLREQVVVARSLESRLHNTHAAVSARFTNIAQLEMILHHASYEIPTTAQKLMTKKVKQVKEKIDKVKGKRSIIKSLINNPDTTKEQLTEMHAYEVKRITEDSRPDDAELTNNLWLQDPRTSQLEDFPVQNIIFDCRNKTDTETQTSSSATDCDTVLDHPMLFKEDQQKLEQALDSVENSSGATSVKPCYTGQEIASSQADASTTILCSGSNSSSIKTVRPSKPHFKSRSETEDISPKLKNLRQQSEEKHVKSSECPKEQFDKKLCASKRSITQVSGVSEAIAKKPNLAASKSASSVSREIGPKVIENTINLETNENVGHGGKKLDIPSKSGTPKASKSKLQYKSILQYKGPNSRVDKSASGQAILCPYDLTGRCQDRACKFQHFH